MDRTNEAVNLFRKRYGKTPQKLGLPVICIYEREHAFLYASSEEVLKAYKTQEKLYRWWLTWFIWPIVVITIVGLILLFKYPDTSHPLFSAIYAFWFVYMVSVGVMLIMIKQTERFIRLGKNVIRLSYSGNK